MIELLYFASQIQCGAGGSFLNIQVDVYHQQQLVQTMQVNEKALISVDSVNDLNFKYKIINNNTQCNLQTPSEMALTPGSQIPSMAGVYEQDSVQTLLSGLENYEELFLVELGTTNPNSPAFDLQDVVFKVDNDPVVATPLTPITLYAD
ncbi:MAG: hypothetical protein HC930_08625 [Hydrococcus sp. SU_1_0]|nr:hypothetical protein [Hydrococcus sp. SU_1_0]